MNTRRNTNRSETVLLGRTTEASLSDQALDHVIGGLNPQPLPPCHPDPGEDKASPKFSWGVS
ncbi:MAG: hypothetical protein P4L00_12975 [Candidatus Acidoferrales bacterium]|jgi:hypothetical protein|nr:hypothetical protein [Candidatus Acidoferrales bacterium]